MSADARIESIRAWHTDHGKDVSGLSDVDLLVRELDEANAEVNKLNRRDEDHRAGDTARARAIRTSARRRHEDQINRWDTFVFEALSRLSGESVRAALYRAANLTELTSGDDVAETREAASKALRLWERETRDLSGGAGRYAHVNVARQQLREIARLRKLITDHAGSISGHVRARGTLQICECGGCELIRTMDDVADTFDQFAA